MTEKRINNAVTVEHRDGDFVIVVKDLLGLSAGEIVIPAEDQPALLLALLEGKPHLLDAARAVGAPAPAGPLRTWSVEERLAAVERRLTEPANGIFAVVDKLDREVFNAAGLKVRLAAISAAYEGVVVTSQGLPSRVERLERFAGVVEDAGQYRDALERLAALEALVSGEDGVVKTTGEILELMREAPATRLEARLAAVEQREPVPPEVKTYVDRAIERFSRAVHEHIGKAFIEAVRQSAPPPGVLHRLWAALRPPPPPKPTPPASVLGERRYDSPAHAAAVAMAGIPAAAIVRGAALIAADRARTVAAPNPAPAPPATTTEDQG